MNKPASELIALADDYLRVDRAKLAEWADDFEAAAHEVPRGIKSTILMTRAQEVRAALATPPAQPAPAVTHGKPDGAVREALEPFASYKMVTVGFNGAVSTTDLKECTWVAGFTGPQPEFKHFEAARTALSSKIAAAETSHGDVIAVLRKCRDYIASDLRMSRDEDEKARRDNLIEEATAAANRLDVKTEAKSQEPEAVTIKPLEWREFHGLMFYGGDFYRIEDQGENWSHDRFWLYVLGTREGKFRTLDDAKAAAQADYEQRIRSALAHPITKPEAPNVDAIKAACDKAIVAFEQKTTDANGFMFGGDARELNGMRNAFGLVTALIGEILSARITEENMASTADAILAVRLDEAAIRKDEREKQREIDAGIAHQYVERLGPKEKWPLEKMQAGFDIASAIRNGGKQP